MKRPVHNDKIFLLPDSPRSMACVHAKVMEDSIMKITIHDCRGSIQLHNDLTDPEQVNEAIEKLNNLASAVSELRLFIIENYMLE